jgi:hypothetical protein
MLIEDFIISEEQLQTLKGKFPKQGKNSHIGNIAVEVTKLYFLTKSNNKATFKSGTLGADIIVVLNGDEIRYEIKGTEDAEISFQKLKVSSKHSYQSLVDGMSLIRITNIGKTTMKIHFMKHGEDFNLVEEPRWAFKKIKRK